MDYGLNGRVRPGLLVDKTGRIRLQPGETPFRGPAKIGRADLASVFLNVAEKEEARRKVFNGAGEACLTPH